MNFMKVIQSESYKRGALLSVLFNIVSKGILFILTIIIARYFGSNIKTDIYFFVFASMILFSSFINSIDTAVLIPESMRLRDRQGNEKAESFLNFFLFIYSVIGVVFPVLMYFFGVRIFGLISKFSEADIVTYHNYFWIGSFFFVFHILTNYINAILSSLKYFSLPMLISSVKSCITIVCIFLLKADYDVLSVILGGLIGYALNLVFLLLVMKRSLNWTFSFSWITIKERTGKNIFYAALGQVATVLSSMFPLYLLSGFGSGIISVMNYGKNIADIPSTLITAQISTISGIKLNEEVAQNNKEAMNNTFVKTTKLLVFILVPVGFYLFVFAVPVTKVFFSSKNFGAVDVAETAMFLKLLAVTIFSIGINSMVTRVFIALQAVRQAFIYQVILNMLLIAAIWLCTNQYGPYGYPYAVIIVNLFNCLAMYIICKIIAPFIDYVAVLKYAALVIAVNAAIALLLYAAFDYFSTGTWLSILLGLLLYVITLIFVNRRFKLNAELGQFTGILSKEFIKRRS